MCFTTAVYNSGVMLCHYLQVQSLTAMRAASKNKIIPLTTEQFEEFAFSKGRPYHLAVFMAAGQFMNSPKIQLKKLETEFSYAAQVGAWDGCRAVCK